MYASVFVALGWRSTKSVQWVRASPAFRRVPVIMFTSSKEKVDIDRAYELGVNAYLLKSVNHEDLVEALKLVRAFWLTLNLSPTLPVQAAITSA